VMLGRLLPLLVLSALGCSPPPAAKQPEVLVPADDEEEAVAWQKAHPRPPPPYKFEWERVRGCWEKLSAIPLGQLRCDPRGMVPPPHGWCCVPGGKAMQAAKVKLRAIVDESHTWLRLDLGSEALITKEWYAALVDEDGHLITEWLPLQEVNQLDSTVIVPVAYDKIGPASARVALLEELPK
jgi:hypothetical protein